MTASDLPAILGGEPAFADGPPAWPQPCQAVIEAGQKAMQDGSWGHYHGPHCRRLIEALSEYHSAETVHLCSSGTAAVELALRGAKVEPGEEVILAAYDFKANFQNVLAVGGIPVLVDLKPQTWQLDPQFLESACTEKTKAIIVSHLHGGLADVAAVRTFAEQRGITVIEDACQATGAILTESSSDCCAAGMSGDVGVLSFGGSKLLTAGRGGAVLTNRADIAQRIRLYTQRGNDAYPLSELQAAVLLPQLQQLDAENATRLQRVTRLTKLLCDRNLPLKPLAVIPVPSTSQSRPAFYKLGFQYSGSVLSRDLLCSAVRAEGVALDPGFQALHRSHSRRRFRAPVALSQADAADERCLMLHHPVLLEAASTVERVAAAIARVIATARDIADARESAC